MSESLPQLRPWARRNRTTLPYLLTCLALLVVGLIASVFVLAGGPAAWLLALILLVAVVGGWLLLTLVDCIVARFRGQ